MFLWVIQIWQSNALSYSTVLNYESTLTCLQFITVQYVLLARVLSILIILSPFKKYIPPTQKLVKSPVSLNQFNRSRSHGGGLSVMKIWGLWCPRVIYKWSHSQDDRTWTCANYQWRRRLKNHVGSKLVLVLIKFKMWMLSVEFRVVFC